MVGMSMVIILFGVLVFLAGLVLLISPEKVFGLFSQHIEKTGMQVLAVVVRLVLGALLIFQSGDSRYPHAIEIIGWITIIAAILLAVIGRDGFKRLMSWVLTKVRPVGRIGGLAATCFGAFLVYAFI